MIRTLCILITVPLFAADQTLLQQGQASLERGDYAEARRLFEKAAGGDASATGNPGLKAQAYFFLARVEESDPHGSGNRAIAHYEKALEMRPGLAAASNNLAQLLLKQGDNARAIELLHSATQTGDSRRPLYLRNLADAFAASGDDASAMKMYMEVLDSHPDDTQAEEGLLRVMDGPSAAAYLWRLLDSGKLDRAQKLAVDQLRRSDRDASVKRDLLGVAAVALARQHATNESMWTDLRALADDPDIGKGVQDLRRLYGGQEVLSDWWFERRERRPPALSSAEAYGVCAREIAEQFVKAGQREKAETTLRSGIEVARGQDPDTILTLAELYYEEKNVDKIDALLSRYEPALFGGKGGAYARGDLSSIYRFHVALGTMYARLGKNGSESQPKSAIFQLGHAVTTARQNNSRPMSEKIYTDPDLIDLLAKSYDGEKRHKDAQRVRVEAATTFKKEGRTVSVQKVLQPVKVEYLAAPDRKTYDDLVRVTPSVKQTTVKKQP